MLFNVNFTSSSNAPPNYFCFWHRIWSLRLAQATISIAHSKLKFVCTWAYVGSRSVVLIWTKKFWHLDGRRQLRSASVTAYKYGTMQCQPSFPSYFQTKKPDVYEQNVLYSICIKTQSWEKSIFCFMFGNFIFFFYRETIFTILKKIQFTQPYWWIFYVVDISITVLEER